MSDTILTHDEGAVRVVTLNRPDRANAWTLPLEEEYFGALLGAAHDPAVRAIVVTGAGRAFCAGMDAEALKAASSGGFANAGRIRQTLPLSLPKPVVVAINGACAGIGLVVSLMGDVRFVAAGAKITTAFARRGLPAENAVAWQLARLVGAGTAADLLLSGRVVRAEEAAELGLVNRVVAPEELLSTALAYAADMAQNCSPAAMADIKRQLYGGLETDIESARREDKRLAVVARSRPDLAEGVASMLEKRPPRFAGLAATDLVADDFRDTQ
ncbi:enoyl-CoA hydratase-related protein [Pseudonocardia sp. NPDC049154]|uniref:enoyl-CoA hydratase-related protein n=1 Tax=Pseudonocardia sp. NPDC049154 TaxID=3155501 RepID=UPI0033D901C4